MQDLQNILEGEWQKVRKSFYYPQLPMPRLTDDVTNGTFNFENLQISINPNYIKKLQQEKCNENISVNAILGHETGHFVDYPGSILNLLRLHKVARESLDEQQAYAIRETFLNIQNNTNLVQNRNYKTLPPTLKVEAVKAQGFNKIIFGLYQELWKKNLGVKLKRKEKALVKRLKEIGYLDKDRQKQNLKEFIEITREYLQQQEEKYKPKDHNSARGFSENQIREGIRQFANESEPGEFEKIAEEVLKEIEQEKGEAVEEEQQVLMKGAGTEKGNLIIARNYYSALAENFSVPIRKKQMQKNGGLYPHSHEEFSMDDTMNDLDPYSSLGIIPGITQKWIKKEGEVTTNYFGIPDSLVVIDSSSSMPNPDDTISIPVLGATVIANAYLNNNAKVTIYNFSGDDIVIGPSKNKERIHKTIRTYQNGGTVFNADTIGDIVKKQDSVDISVISDMKIHNLDEFLDYVSNLPNVHRVHLFYTNSGNIEGIARELRQKENVAILPLHSQNNIKKITMGELKKSIK